MDLLVLTLPPFNLAATTAFIDPFRAANYLEGEPLYRWTLASPEGGLARASNTFAVETQPLAEVRQRPFDLVMVSASWTPERHTSKALRVALQAWARRGSAMGGLDTGAFVLAAAGLLEGRRATVHYEHIDALIELHPEVEVSEELFVFDGDRITCCGGGASGDLALHILRGLHGDALANAAARYVFHESLRPRGARQNPWPAAPLGGTAPVAVERAIGLMERHLEEPIAIPEICARLGISQRQLNRLFVRHVKKPPASYYRDIRLDRARGLVTQTEMALSEVAVASGFASPVHFSRAYRQRFGLAPRRDRVQGRVPFEYRAWPMYRKGG